MAAIIDQLRQEHANLTSVLAALERQVRIFASDAHPDYELMQAAVDYFLGFPEGCHHPKEDIVFSRLLARDATTPSEIGDLHAAHVKLKDNLRNFAAALRAVIADAEIPREAFVQRADAFIELQRRHMAMEETSFFPAAERALDADDWRAVKAMLSSETDPLSRKTGDERFDAIRRDIVAWEG
jgi:hemerythrin-like domain-containing protein